MTVYAYKGNQDTPRGKSVRGSVVAESPLQAREMLRDQGIVLTSVEPIPDNAVRFAWLNPSIRRARDGWSLAAQELSLLLAAGIPMLESLDTLVAQHPGKLKTALQKLRDSVAAGSSLADGMLKSPLVFDNASIRMVEVGENAGTLETVLAEIAKHRIQMLEFKDKVLTALLYPAFLLVFGIAAMLFLMTSVMPPLLENLSETLDVLPAPTRIAKSISEFLVDYGFILAFALLAIVIATAFFVTTSHGRLWLDRTLLRIPTLGSLLTKQSVARAAMTVSTLSRSGLPLPDAMQMAARSTNNAVIRQTFEQCVIDLGEGKELGQSLSKSTILPPLAVRFFSVGQESGQLDEMLQRLAEDYNKQVTVATARLTALVEPILILVMASLIGFLLVATILPILEAGNLAR